MAQDEQPLARARNLLDQGRFIEAEAAARSVIQRDPSDAASYVVLSRALTGQGNHDAARIAAERAISLDPYDPLKQVALATACLAGERFDLAESAARRAIALDPSLARAHMVLGSALHERGKTAEAEQEFDRAIALEPPTSEGERIWKRWRAPVIVATSVVAFLLFHALRLLGTRFTDRIVAVLLAVLTFVLVAAVLIGLAMQRRRLSKLAPSERALLEVERRRRRSQDRGRYLYNTFIIAAVIVGLSIVTILFAIGQRPTTTVAVGDCFSSDRIVSIEQVATIPCFLPHDFEVFAVLAEPSPHGAPYPGLETLHARLRTQCEQLYEGYVGVPYGDTAPTGFHTFVPEESYWRLDVRTEFCALHDWRKNRQLIGSKRA